MKSKHEKNVAHRFLHLVTNHLLDVRKKSIGNGITLFILVAVQHPKNGWKDLDKPKSEMDGDVKDVAHLKTWKQTTLLNYPRVDRMTFRICKLFATIVMRKRAKESLGVFLKTKFFEL